MLVNGRFVNATEWWDPHWIEDRVTRKLNEVAIRREPSPHQAAARSFSPDKPSAHGSGSSSSGTTRSSLL